MGAEAVELEFLMSPSSSFIISIEEAMETLSISRFTSRLSFNCFHDILCGLFELKNARFNVFHANLAPKEPEHGFYSKLLEDRSFPSPVEREPLH